MRHGFGMLCFGIWSVLPLYGSDNNPWSELLKKYVSDDGRVNYTAWRRDAPAAWPEVLKTFSQASPSKMSPPEQRAFWINAYNAIAIDGILKRPHLKRVNDEFAVFDATASVAGMPLSLNDIEHRILRARAVPPPVQGPVENVDTQPFDYRIHFALTSGTVGSPLLRQEAYSGENLARLLEENEERFLASPKHLRIERGRLVLSSIFKWYAADFESQGGVSVYLVRKLESGTRTDKKALQKLLQTRFSSTHYFYDWALNEIRPSAH